ncbi:PDC sensor domain-containing protein [Leptothoe sp. PORK10 BA2]|uniref:PDC sensor domain-containing protein n=1 Tax=Leptothoe sp. PORK10 BA2 TaxID=3110254 RepID=UPI002B211621|nr:hypothetical protein [Leptothoe sp. PORK10 BA2]MEA5466987.1 hypothetical protein [Leptothoe sp. PORK10 BA2]
MTDQLHILQVNAEEDLKLSANKSTISPLRQQVVQTEEQRYQLLPQQDKSLPPLSSVQGIGSLSHQSEDFERELNMALRLTPIFRGIKENLQEVTWIYYLSAQAFISLYPRNTEFAFEQSVLELPFFTQGLPENNPQRQTSWTEAYLDLAGQGMMVTANAPIYYNDQFRGTVAMDITLDRLDQAIQNFDYAQGTLFILG